MARFPEKVEKPLKNDQIFFSKIGLRHLKSFIVGELDAKKKSNGVKYENFCDGRTDG